MRWVLGRLVLIAILVVAVSTSAQAFDWADYATVSMTDPLTPKLSANRVCYSDGRDLLCDGAAGLLTTSGTLQVTGLVAGGVTITGNTSATYISTTAIQISSQTTPITCNSGNAGTLRYNSPTLSLELCTGSGWQTMGVGIPAGTISAFASTTCPIGWSEYTAARGRFLRGIDNGAGNDPDGTRAPGSTQADALQNITGNIAEYYGGAQSGGGGGAFASYSDTSGVVGTNATVSKASGYSFDASRVVRTSVETRAKNVAITYCQFNGTSNGWNNPLNGGSTVAAGSTGQIQFNGGGNAFAGSSGLTWTNASNLLTATNISATALTVNGVPVTGGGLSDRIVSASAGVVAGNGGTVSFTTGGVSGSAYLATTGVFVGPGVSTTGAISATGIYSNGNAQISGSLQYGGNGTESCSSAADYGKSRRNPVSGHMQVCMPR